MAIPVETTHLLSRWKQEANAALTIEGLGRALLPYLQSLTPRLSLTILLSLPGEDAFVKAYSAIAEGNDVRENESGTEPTSLPRGIDLSGDGRSVSVRAQDLRRSIAGIPGWGHAATLSPLVSRGEIGGCQLIVTPAGAELSPVDTAWLELLASTTADALARLRAQNQAEEVLTRDTYRSLEYAADALLVSDLDGHYLFTNDRASELTGYERSELLEMGIEDLVPPEEREVRPLRLDDLEWPGDPLTIERPIRRKDGARIEVEVSARRIAPNQVQVILRDITERKRLEGELVASERRWRAMVRNSGDVIALLDGDHRVIYANDALARSTGFTSEELNGEDIFTLVHPDDLPRVQAEFAALLEREGSRNVHYRLRHQDGSWHHWEAVASNNLDDPAVRAIIVNTRDVTPQRMLEAEAERQRQLLTSALNSLPGAFYLFDRDRRYRLWNRTLERITETPPEKMRDADPLDFSVEEDRSRVAAAIEEAFTTGSTEVEAQLLTRSGERIPFLFTGRRVQIEGEPHLVGLGIDISERQRALDALQESEELFRVLTERLPAAVVLTAGSEILYVNPEAERLSGYTIEELQETGWPLSPESLPTVLQRRQAFQDGATDLPPMELKLITRQQQEGWVESAITRVTYQGRPAELSIAWDITDRKHHEQERQQLLHDMRERVKELRLLHEAAILFQDDNLSAEECVERLVRLIPAGWQYSADSRARIQIGRFTTSTPGFRETPWTQRAEFRTANRTRGRIEVAYRSEHPEADDGPFLTEEKQLLNSLTQMLHAFLEQREERARSEELTRDLATQVSHLVALQRIDTAIITSSSMETSLGVFLDQVVHELKVDAADVLLYNEATQTLDFEVGTGFWTETVRTTPLRLGEGYGGRVAHAKRPLFVPDLASADPPPLRNFTREKFASYYGLPLESKGELKGVLGLFHREPLTPDPEWEDFALTLAQQAAIAIDNAQLFERLRSANQDLQFAYDSTIEGWARALDLKDEETAGHSVRVTDMTVELARRLGVAEEELRHVRRGALLHDIGKMAVPDRILLKPGKLDPDEWEVMKRHTIHAYELLSPIPFLRDALAIPHCHHERFDGTGYPRGLRGEEIPLAARIFAVVDVFDALSSDRPYRAAWPRDRVIAHLKEGAGSHFDSDVLAAFLTMIEGSARRT